MRNLHKARLLFRARYRKTEVPFSAGLIIPGDG